jgi:arylsulfatase A-like enzyme
MLFASFIKPHPPFESPAPWNRLHRSPEMPDPLRPEGFENHQCFWNHVQNRYKYRDVGYDRQHARNIIAAYRCAVSFVDYNIGRIIESLGDEAENTLIVVSSDHGEMLGDFGSYGKRCMLDPAIRVPMIVSHPKLVPAGKRSDVPVTLVDLFSTFTAAAGARENPDETSVDLLSVARGEETRKTAFTQFSERSLGLYMASDSRGKYIYSAADEREWYFDHSTDPKELKNQIAEPALQAHVAELRPACLKNWSEDSWATTEGAWRKYGKTAIPEDPDYGLLYQDPAHLEDALAGLGEYSRGLPAMKGDLIEHCLPKSLDPVTGLSKLSES